MLWDHKEEWIAINENRDDIEKLREYSIEHDKRMEKLAHDIDLLIARKPDYLSVEEKARLADLEVKMAKLWALLVETTPLGKDKLSKIGRRFGGMSKNQ